MKTQFKGMVKPLARVAAVALTATSLIGCLEEGQNTGRVDKYNVEDIVKDNNLTPEEKSEKLALIGEKLSTPSGFVYADEVLTLALSYDSKNLRAQFYKKFNAPVIALKGSMNRLLPLVPKFSPRAKQAYEDGLQIMAINRTIEDFFVSGPHDIYNESQAQALLDQVQAAQNDLRLFFRNHRGIRLQLHSVVPAGELADIWYNCPVHAFGDAGSYHSEYSVQNCHYLHNTEYEIDDGDREALQHIAAGLQIFFIVTNSYDLTGIAKVDTVLHRRSLNVQQRISLLQRQQQLGRLRGNQSLKMVQTLGTDMYAGVRWAQSFSDRLCPKGWEQEQRPGKLFSKGLCAEDHPTQKPGTFDTAVNTIALALAGQNVEVFTREGSVNVMNMADSREGAEYVTAANLLQPFVNPRQDLKSILPTKFDKCGRSTNLGDFTAGGLFPRGDAEKVAKNVGLIWDECK